MNIVCVPAACDSYRRQSKKAIDPSRIGEPVSASCHGASQKRCSFPAVVGRAKQSAIARCSVPRTLTANEWLPTIATCVSLLRLMLAIISGGSRLIEATALAVIPARSGPCRAATTVTPVAKRPIIARSQGPRSSSIGSAVALQPLDDGIGDRPVLLGRLLAAMQVHERDRVPRGAVNLRDVGRQVAEVQDRHECRPALSAALDGAFERRCELLWRAELLPDAHGDQAGGGWRQSHPSVR